MSGSITIDGMPIPIDWNHQLKNFLSVRLPPERILFARDHREPIINSLGCDSQDTYLKPLYPPLPPIEIGEYQCPTGMSRYGRALLVVDWYVLSKIAIKCWGYSLPVTVEGQEDIPERWKETSSTQVEQTVVVQFLAEKTLSIKMIPLAPHRITGAGVDLWLLPLVDRRYFFNQNVVNDFFATGIPELDEEEPEPPPEEPPPEEPPPSPPSAWTKFFRIVLENIGMLTDNPATNQFDENFAISAEYGKVDQRLVKTSRPQFISTLLDTAALSVQQRIVYEPSMDKFYLYDASISTQIRNRRILGPKKNIADPLSGHLPNATLIAGGRCGAALRPNSLQIWHKVDGDWTAFNFLNTTIGGGNAHSDPAIWTSWEGDSETTEETEAFCERLSRDILGWWDSGGHYCLAGVNVQFRTTGEGQSQAAETTDGFVDFFSIQIGERQPGEGYFVTRYHELPPLFMPPAVLSGGDETCQSALFETPEGGIGESSGTGNWGQALCARIKFDGTESKKQKVYNTSDTPIEGNVIIKAIRVDGHWIAVVGGGGDPAFFKLTEAVTDQIQCKARRCNYIGDIVQIPNPDYDPRETIPDPEDPDGPEIPNPDYNPSERINSPEIDVVNWERLLDGAPSGFIAMYAPVNDEIDNPDFDDAETIPDPEDPDGPEIPNPDYDPRETVKVRIWAFMQAACIVVPPEEPPPEEPPEE
ncbi:MAG: hypothetical protein KF752_11655 [Pirellulaceae bacterium]|nr:hypothetical protein [Pirellulaceae bacterium]